MEKVLKASHFSTLNDSTMSVVVSMFPSLCSFFLLTRLERCLHGKP